MNEQTPWWASENLWRKLAIWVTAGMFVLLIVLTMDTHPTIEAGGANVPDYNVINKRIGYQYDDERDIQVPVIKGDNPLFDKTYTEAEARELVSKGKMVIQARNCMNCHTILGNGAYYAPDLTKAWLDPSWGTPEARERLMLQFLMEPDKYYRTFGTNRRMPDLNLSEKEARAVMAFLKWMSAIDTNGFPYGFRTIAEESTQ